MNEENKMKSVWVIEEGEYSDYRVVGVFSTKANAELVAKHTDGSIAEWPLDPSVAEINQGLKVFFVQMQKDGTVDRCEPREIDSYGLLTIGASIWRRSEAPVYKGMGVPDVLNATVWAKDETHAIKIANEHRAERIASGEFR